MENHIEAKVYLIENPASKVVGNASIDINGIFAVKHLQVVDGEKGLFTRMPQYKTNEGLWKDICFPLSGDLRKQINDKVVGAYIEAVRERENPQKSVIEQIREGEKRIAEQTEKPGKIKTAEKEEL